MDCSPEPKDSGTNPDGDACFIPPSVRILDIISGGRMSLYTGHDRRDADRRNARSLAKKNRLNLMMAGGIRPGGGVGFGSYFTAAGVILLLAG